MKRVCKFCSGSMKGKLKNAKFCSRECAQRFRREAELKLKNKEGTTIPSRPHSDVESEAELKLKTGFKMVGVGHPVNCLKCTWKEMPGGKIPQRRPIGT